MKQNLVSVIIPAYNHEKYVQGTIKSIIAQTYDRIELIVVDDGSKDSTWQKIQEMRPVCEERFHSVHFETKSNEGTCKTLNRLLTLAQGKYIYIIASDDLAKPSAIEREVEFLDKNPEYALVVGDDEFIDSEGNRVFLTKDNKLVYDEEKADYRTFVGRLTEIRGTVNFHSSAFGSYPSLCRANYIPNGYLIRRSIFDVIGGFTPEAPLEDWYLMLQISKYAKMKYLDEILFSYRLHGNNTVNNSAKMQMMKDKTRRYEAAILEQIDPEKVFPEVIVVKETGALYQHHRILGFIEILKYLRGDSKIKVIKLFGMTVCRYTKKC